ncbi:MAG: helix-turn-helix domain-containing protein [Actinomycetales bacterium]|nr:helix-turn-helix domain-containing protein [Actinomycetales bacterium]
MWNAGTGVRCPDGDAGVPTPLVLPVGGRGTSLVSVSKFPHCDDVLPADIPTVNLPEVSDRLGIPVTRVHDLLRDGALIAIKRDGVVVVPEVFFDDDDEVVRFLPGLVSVLRDGGYQDDEILRWLFEADESLPGRPADALHGHRAREVVRRAQAMAF